MSASLAQRLEAARQRAASLECSFRVYREGYPEAAARVAAQLDQAYLDLARLEREAKQ